MEIINENEIHHDGKVYEAVEDQLCQECELEVICLYIPCQPDKREDNRDVIFKEKKGNEND